ncbi:MAG TPA: hypothetical protein VFO53_02985 [Casimicrobiaceae bacterium]|nr:hypothetical protein [Casimicrobiaceae bacterium]
MPRKARDPRAPTLIDAHVHGSGRERAADVLRGLADAAKGAPRASSPGPPRMPLAGRTAGAAPDR